MCVYVCVWWGCLSQPASQPTGEAVPHTAHLLQWNEVTCTHTHTRTIASGAAAQPAKGTTPTPHKRVCTHKQHRRKATNTNTHAHAHTHARTHARTRAHARAHTHTRTHAHTHTHHLQRCRVDSSQGHTLVVDLCGHVNVRACVRACVCMCACVLWVSDYAVWLCGGLQQEGYALDVPPAAQTCGYVPVHTTGRGAPTHAHTHTRMHACAHASRRRPLAPQGALHARLQAPHAHQGGDA